MGRLPGVVNFDVQPGNTLNMYKMTFQKILKHFGIIIASLVLLLGVPLVCTGKAGSLFSGDLDAVSSASVILDQPSGNYIILINKELHQNEDNLNQWITFFSGGEILYIFEDISCSVANADVSGLELAKSFQSKLPENQMQIVTEDATLLMSRADKGLYDIIIMSAEFAETYSAQTAYGSEDEVVEFAKEADESESTEAIDGVTADTAETHNEEKNKDAGDEDGNVAGSEDEKLSGHEAGEVNLETEE